MNPQFLAAGLLAIAAAAIHGGAGEVLLLRNVSVAHLPSSRFGGPIATMVMIRVTWHVATLTFAVIGFGLMTCGFLGTGDSCRGIGVMAGSSFSGFFLLAIVMGLRGGMRLFGHKGPLAFLVVAALAWWGSF